jgi:hypothetical protein
MCCYKSVCCPQTSYVVGAIGYNN